MEKLHREETDKLKKAAVYAFVKKPKDAVRPYCRKIGSFLKKAAPALLLTTILATTALADVTHGAINKAEIENAVDALNLKKQIVLTDMVKKASVINDVGEYLKQHPDVKLDVSNITFNADDLAQMQGKGCEESKRVEKIAKTVSSENGYCARAVKKIVHKAGLLKDCSAKDREDFLNVGAAWQLKPFFDRGCVDGFTKINLTEDAARSRKPVLMFRVNEQWEGVERDANGRVVPNHAHVQAEGVGGYYFGQSNRNSCPYGHRDKTGIVHEYGTASYYAFDADINGLVQSVAYQKKLMAVVDGNTLTCFSNEDVPEKYQGLVAQHRENEKNTNGKIEEHYVVEDALRVERPVEEGVKALLAQSGSETALENIGASSLNPTLLAQDIVAKNTRKHTSNNSSFNQKIAGVIRKTRI